jgi:hypothetical protein
MLSASDRRTIVVGLVVMAGTVALSRAAPHVRRHAEARQRSALIAARELVNARRGLEQGDAVHEQLRAVRAANTTLHGWVLMAGSLSHVNVTMHRALSDAAAAHGLEVMSVAPAPEPKTGASGARQMRAVRARAVIVGDLAPLARFLARIESARPRFLVRQMTLSRSDGMASGQIASPIRCELIVEMVARLDSLAGSSS